MAGLKRRTGMASLFMAMAIITASCNQQFSEAPVATNTPINPETLFATPIGANEPQDEIQLTEVKVFATQTALAANPGAQVTATLTPLGGSGPTVTASPFVSLPGNPTVTPTATLAVPPAGPSLTPLPVQPSGTRPSTWVLKSEEFPYCIARRFNLDPDSLIRENQLASGTIYYAGYELNLRNVASPFPGVRALRPHPATYVVTGNADTTIYGVACKFGDVDPGLIAQQNGLSLGATLTVGQSLNIP